MGKPVTLRQIGAVASSAATPPPLACRPDCFETLSKRGRTPITPGQLECVRTLQAAMARRCTQVSFTPMRVDTSIRPGAYDARVVNGSDVSDAIKVVLSQCGALDRETLEALLDPNADAASSVNWRATVQSISGVSDETEQAGLVRFACFNLQRAFTDCPDECRVLQRAATYEQRCA